MGCRSADGLLKTQVRQVLQDGYRGGWRHAFEAARVTARGASPQ
jgi:hypothetical protein